MIALAITSFQDLLSRPLRRLAIWVLIATVLLSLVLIGITDWGLGAVQIFASHYLDEFLHTLGVLAAIGIIWLIFPAFVAILAGFGLERASRAVEMRHFPDLAAPPPRSLLRDIWIGVRLALLALGINLMMLPIYLFFTFIIPLSPLIPLIFIALNAYLFGRIYFDLVAVRRLPYRSARQFRHEHNIRVWLFGAIIALFSLIPVINLFTPLYGTILMTHLFEDLRRRALLA